MVTVGQEGQGVRAGRGAVGGHAARGVQEGRPAPLLKMATVEVGERAEVGAVREHGAVRAVVDYADPRARRVQWLFGIYQTL